MAERLFLPARRGSDIVIYEYREQPALRRWEFHAAAIRDGQTGALDATGVVGLDDAALARCAGVADQLPRIEAAVATLDICRDDRFSGALDMERPAAILDGSALLTVCMYLQFARQSLVLESSFRRYEARPAAERLDLGLSASVYDGLLKRHELARAEVLLDADAPHLPPRIPQHREWGYLLGLAASIKQRLGKPQEAIVFARQAATAAPTAQIWRRIGNLAEETGARDEAIDAFLHSEKYESLQPDQALRLAWWLVHEERIDQAREWHDIALARGAPPAPLLHDRLARAGSGGMASA